MPEESTIESATDLAFTLAWVAGAVVATYFLGVALSWVVQRIGRRSAVVRAIEVLTRMPVRTLFMLIAATIALGRTSDPDASWRSAADHTLRVLMIAAVTWLIANLVRLAERRMIARFAGGATGLTDADVHRRKVQTQLTVLRRLAVAIVVLLGIAAALMTFPAFADIGTTLFASAGVLSVVAGLAAQTSLGAVFAGLQIAFTDAIKVGDVVVIEKEWGRIEEITLTYVVVTIWDERRLILPCTYFTTTPFENWTRNATEVMGIVELDVDFTVPLEEMRAELKRILAANEHLWDERLGVLEVTSAINGHVRVWITVSAPNSSALWGLRCAVREAMINWLQRRESALPRWRFEPAPAPEPDHRPVPPSSRVASEGVFTGSEEAEERARAFEGEDERV
ncbi:mechanosensitive ion channel family protein [[Mycobacterium] burgundiense]|uniref:Mechanosensitive ion channel n=1 Tax=[Mycobacterium] burgundiense TaxID=3064286 RepID=A0ABN9NUG6_9MYCO|nr:mechanosensitive ion channel domain-containing protein [Mycolicibacterium sp. MU0053]CAJ1509956.1 mechanosensitive ion channel [Mycolicibacterium sp. MU0053]